MNQLQPLLVAMKKWGFWVICGLAVIVGLAVWFIAQQSVQASIKARKEQLDGLKSQISGVKPNSPNPKVIEAARQQIEALKTDVYQAWVTMYADQKEKNQWPKALGSGFLNWVNQPGRKFGDPIPERFREIYLNFIEQHFPTLFEIINLRRPANVDLKQLGSIRAAMAGGYGTSGYGSGAYPGATGTMGEESYGETMGYPGAGAYPGASTTGTGPGGMEMVGIVEWNPQNIAAIKQRFAWRQVPTSDEIWNAQEDLWVYEALLRIIAKTNENATGPHNAAVKRINAVQIGPDAAGYFASASASTMASATGVMGSPGTGSPGMETGMPSQAGGEYESGYVGYGGTGMRSMFGRYVDASGNPLPPGAAQPFAEFKMMPVRLDLVVDQRRIDQLLVNCANSDMPVRITRVLIRPGQASRGGTGYGGLGGESGMMTGTFGYGYGGEGGYETGASPGSGYGVPGATQATSSHDVPIVIEGVIYLFNPPDQEQLGKQGAPELVSGQSLAPIEAPPAETASETQGSAAPQPAGAPAPQTQPAGAPPGAAGPQPPAATPPQVNQPGVPAGQPAATQTPPPEAQPAPGTASQPAAPAAQPGQPGLANP